MIVVLLGYMGCGKSTVGQILAKNLKTNFLDLDDYIEQKQNTSISEIFNTKGELFFRTIESDAVKQLCHNFDSLVLALGGGTPCYSDTMQFLVNHPNVKTVFLNLSIKNLSDRLIHEKAKRPLIANLNDADYQNFELHASEEHELVVKILSYAGVIIRAADITQAAAAKEQQIIQSER